MRVLVTGVGTKYGAAWAKLLDEDHTVTGIGSEDCEGIETVIADRTEYDEIRPVFDGQDAVIDMPAAGEPNSAFEQQLTSLEGTNNFLRAADAASVESYIVGSSNMVVQGYEVDHAPGLYEPGYDFELDHTAVPRPLSMYGVSRLFSENLARRYVEAEDWQLGRHVVEGRDFPTRVYVLRWGSVRAWNGMDHPYSDAEYGVAENMWTRDSDEYELAVKRMKATWLSGQDLRQLVSLMLADDTVSFDVFYGVSETDRGWLDISHAKDVLGYAPKDNVADWSSPPS